VKHLHISDELSLSLDAITQKFAFIARSGAGKTYAASKLTEEMLDAGAQVVVLDVVGTWFGLRLAADGKGEGIPIPIFGGEHGDVPLAPHHGALVADAIIDRTLSVVLDVSGFTGGELRRFATDFAERFFHRKKTHRSAVHLVLEEAQVLVPQRVMKGEERMLGAFEKLCKLGRNYGIGYTLISQRPQAVHKDVLSQTEALFVLQTNGAHERKALEQWIVEQSGDKKLVDELPGLPVGTAYVWSPQWLRIFRKVKIAPKRTLNASATPTFGATAKATGELAPVDLEALRSAMATAVAEAEKDDPKTLRKRIAELEAKLAKAPVGPPQVKIERVEVIPNVVRNVLSIKAEKLQGAAHRLRELPDYLDEIASALLACVRETPAGDPKAKTPYPTNGHAVVAPAKAPRQAPMRPSTRENVASADADGDLGKGERATLTAIAQHANGVTRAQLTVLTGYKRSTRNTYLQRLGAWRLIVERGSRFVATDAGVAELGADFEPLPTGDALRTHVLGSLPEGERTILQVLVDAYPDAVDREAISEATTYTRSSRNTYIQRLGARELVEVAGDGVKASPMLFDA
jgi:DNA helicase HerA-like ATPase